MVMYMYMYIYVYINTHTHLYTYMYIYIDIHIYIHIHTHMYIHTYICVCPLAACIFFALSALGPEVYFTEGLEDLSAPEFCGPSVQADNMYKTCNIILYITRMLLLSL